MKINRHSMLAAAVCAAVAAAPAQAGCWKDNELAAARVRQLQTMLMVATLKCHAAGIDITGPYNGFVNARRTTIDSANGEIKRHFEPVGGQDAYDRFTTMLANGYSADATNAEACGQAAQLALDATPDATDLIRIAEQRVSPDALPGGLCNAPQLASAAPVPPVQAQTAPIMASASAAPAASVASNAVPPEVAAAMAVIAAYERAHSPAVAAPAAAGIVQTAAVPQ